MKKILCLVLAVVLACSGIPHMDVSAQKETIEEKFDYRELENAKERIVSEDVGRYMEPKVTEGSVPVGASLTVSGKGWKFPEGAINYPYIYQESRAIASVAQKGIYLLNYDKLTFYSLENLKGGEVYAFPQTVEDSYVAGGKLYVLSVSGSSEEYDSLVSIYD